MTKTFIFLSLLLSAASSFANCQNAKAKRDLFNMFKVEGRNSNWIAVRTRDSFQRERGPSKLEIVQGNSLQSSVINFKRDTLNLNGAVICIDPQRSTRILLQHDDYDGTLAVSRIGTTFEDSIIRLKKVGALLQVYIRPAAVVE